MKEGQEGIEERKAKDGLKEERTGGRGWIDRRSKRD